MPIEVFHDLRRTETDADLVHACCKDLASQQGCSVEAILDAITSAVVQAAADPGQP
jgi:hypothetical protein